MPPLDLRDGSSTRGVASGIAQAASTAAMRVMRERDFMELPPLGRTDRQVDAVRCLFYCNCTATGRRSGGHVVYAS